VYALVCVLKCVCVDVRMLLRLWLYTCCCCAMLGTLMDVCHSVPATTRLAIAAAIARDCLSKLGAPMVYEVAMGLSTDMQSLSASVRLTHLSTLYEDPAATAAAAAGVSSHSETASSLAPTARAGTGSGKGAGAGKRGAPRAGRFPGDELGSRRSTAAAVAALETVRTHRASLSDKCVTV
jgi:hypothetical protein